MAVPLWLDRAPSRGRQRYPPLKGHLDVDAVVIGGGIVGASVAETFARAGVRVAVVEANLVGHGSTAANSALLMQEPDEHLGALTRRYGGKAARRIWELSRGATRDFVKTLRRLKIACDLVERDTVYYTMENRKIPALRAEHRRRRAAGFGGRWLDAAALQRATGIRGAAAIRTTGNAQLNPYRACRGLMHAAHERGARVFERSAVRRVDATSTGVIVRTQGGTIAATSVIVATGYATRMFKPLAGRFKMAHTYVLATHPIASHSRRAMGLGDVMLWDTRRPYHYARWTADRRLLLGGGDRPLDAPRLRARAFAEGTREVRQYFEDLFHAPDLARPAYAWEGLFASTPDGLPFIGPHRRYPRHLFALGYGGNGMTFGFLAAKLLLEQFKGVRSADRRLFAFDRFR
jgi:glycine/D-amino acid oxidase-like deaminating enzyme